MKAEPNKFLLSIGYALLILLSPILAVICAAAWIIALLALAVVSLIDLIAEPEGYDL